MANLTITNSFTAGTSIASAQVNTNFSDVKTWLNNRDNATDFWLNMKVSATASNPGEIKSSSADCEFDIDSTGTNGTPRISWRRSGTTYFTAGVDGAASNVFKFSTTALTTNIAFQIPTTGVQVQFQPGSVSTPGMSFIGASNYGFYQPSPSTVALSVAGALMWTSNGAQVAFGVVAIPQTDNTISCGANGARWSAVWAGNGTIQTSVMSSKTNIEDVLPQDISIPKPIFFTRPGEDISRQQVGFAADTLPIECFAVKDDGTRSTEDVYTSSVVGMLCAAARADYDRLNNLDARLAKAGF